MNNWKEYLKIIGIAAVAVPGSKLVKHFFQETSAEQFHSLTLVVVVAIGLFVCIKLLEIMEVLKEIRTRMHTE